MSLLITFFECLTIVLSFLLWAVYFVKNLLSQPYVKATRQRCGQRTSVRESVNASQPLREQSRARLLLRERFLSSSSTATVSLSPSLQASWTRRGATAEERRSLWALRREPDPGRPSSAGTRLWLLINGGCVAWCGRAYPGSVGGQGRWCRCLWS